MSAERRDNWSGLLLAGVGAAGLALAGFLITQAFRPPVEALPPPPKVPPVPPLGEAVLSVVGKPTLVIIAVAEE